MIVCIEFASMNRGTELLDLLYFPENIISSENFTIKVSKLAEGRKRAVKITQMRNYISKLSKSTFNELEMNYFFEPFRLAKSQITISRIECQLKLFPPSKLWSDPETWPQPFTHAVKREALSSGRRSYFMKEGEFIKHPAFYSIYMQAEGAENSSDVVEDIYHLLAGGLSPQAAQQISVGYCHIESEERAQAILLTSMFVRLAPWWGSKMQLDRRFDDVHPILVGPIDVCRSLQDEEPDIKLHQLDQSNVGILQIPDQDINPHFVEKHPEYFVERNEATRKY
jgi:hypothetical protein